MDNSPGIPDKNAPCPAYRARSHRRTSTAPTHRYSEKPQPYSATSPALSAATPYSGGAIYTGGTGQLPTAAPEAAASAPPASTLRMLPRGSPRPIVAPRPSGTPAALRQCMHCRRRLRGWQWPPGPLPRQRPQAPCPGSHRSPEQLHGGPGPGPPGSGGCNGG